MSRRSKFTKSKNGKTQLEKVGYLLFRKRSDIKGRENSKLPKIEPTEVPYVEIKDAQRVLAFVSSLKNKRINSILQHHDETPSMAAKRLNIDFKGYKKYFHALRILNVSWQDTKGNIRVRSIPEVLGILAVTCNNPLFNSNLHFFNNMIHSSKIDRTKLTHRDFLKFIQESLLLQKLIQQEAHHKEIAVQLRKQGIETNRQKVRGDVSLIKDGKELSQEVIESNPTLHDTVSLLNRGVVTGKSHVAKILGSSNSTGARTLRRIAAKKFVDRKIVYKNTGVFLNPSEYSSAPQLREVGAIPYNSVICKKTGEIQEILGSSIIINKDLELAYKAQKFAQDSDQYIKAINIMIYNGGEKEKKQVTAIYLKGKKEHLQSPYIITTDSRLSPTMNNDGSITLPKLNKKGCSLFKKENSVFFENC
jgi:hypothetical protein